MTTDNIKRMLDAFYLAKRIREMLPLLPDGVSPSFIRYLDITGKLEKKNGSVKISDLSDALSVQRPGVTRTLREMEEKGYIRKIISDEDRRVTYIEITERGRALSQKYNEETFTPLLDALASVSDGDVETLIKTIELFYEAMKEGGKYNG